MSEDLSKSGSELSTLQNTVAVPEKPLRVITKSTGAVNSISGSMAVTVTDWVANLILPLAASGGTEINTAERSPILGEDNSDVGKMSLAIH